MDPEGDTKEEELEEPRLWRSCCLECDRSIVLYATKTIFSGIILGFSMYIIILHSDDPCKDLAFPTGLIGAILGSFAEQGSQHNFHK